MSTPLLSTKLYIPRLQPGGIRRARLSDRLLSGLAAPGAWALLSGPAGFGKTTLLGEFIERYQKPVAWLSLDAADNDPARFWTYFVTACQSIQPGLGESALALFRSPQPVPVEAVPTVLINALAGQTQDLVLVLDDYHLIQDQAIHAAMSFLLEHAPDRLHLVFSTRIDPPWPLARFRSHGRLVEIRAVDLRFTEAEAADFLSHTMQLTISPADIAALDVRTEGWIAGLQLAALSMRGRDDIPGFVKAFTGSHTFVAEYLVEEVLQHQPKAMQIFLLQTSILERLNAGLCEAVSGNQDGQAALSALQRANLFLLPLDDDGRWFRYHHLFADLLQVRLQQTCTPEAVNALHARAADWFEKNDFAVEAVNHALSARDFDLAARLVEQNTYPLVTRGELTTLIGWIDALPGSLNVRPQFLLAKAWALLFAGNVDQIEALLKQMDAQIEINPGTPSAIILQGSAAAIRAFFTLMTGDLTHALELAETAGKILPPAGTRIDPPNPFLDVAHSVLPYTLGMAYRGQGQYEQAARAFEQELNMFADPRDLLGWTIAMTEVAVLRRMQGRLQASEEVCRQALARIAELGAYPSGSLARVDATLSEVLRERNELDEAGQRLNDALERMRTWNMPTDNLSALMNLMRLQLSQGNLSGAKDTLLQCEELRASHPVFWDLSRSLDLLEVRLAFAEGDIPTATRLLDAIQPGSSPIVFLREQELILLARLHESQGHFEKALEILTPLGIEAGLAGRLYAWLNILVQQALTLEASGDRKTALEVLEQALGFARTEGFVRVYVDQGLAMRKLLEEAARETKTEELRPYLARLLDAFPADPAPKKHSDLIEPLTARELEVLNLIAIGDSNQAIADKLVITVSAIKKHTNNIFGKLNVNSRTQAVARARRLGLLPVDR